MQNLILQKQHQQRRKRSTKVLFFFFCFLFVCLVVVMVVKGVTSREPLKVQFIAVHPVPCFFHPH